MIQENFQITENNNLLGLLWSFARAVERRTTMMLDIVPIVMNLLDLKRGI
jgi:hypothetical protein